MEAELQAITRMGETALFTVSERLLRAFSRGRLWTPVNLRSVVYRGDSGIGQGYHYRMTNGFAIGSLEVLIHTVLVRV